MNVTDAKDKPGMAFVLPCAEYEGRASEFIREFRSLAPDIHGDGGLDKCLAESSYSAWLLKVRRDLDIANAQPGRVPAFTYFYVRDSDGVIVGIINIRLALNDFLREEGGHIGYCVRPSERRKGYGSAMLRGALAFCANVGLRRVILGCNKSNAASAGVIRNCGGKLEAEFYSDSFKTAVQRYVITTD